MSAFFTLCRRIAPMLLLSLLGASANSQTPLGELFAGDTSPSTAAQPAGTGMTVSAGSQLSAGIAPAVLKLYRGGQVRICPHSKITINSDQRGLMLGMDAGAVEVQLPVEPSATEIVFTPDLSIRLSGPASYHFALGVTGQGDTCFKPLPGNSAGVVLSELLGSDEFGIAADQSAFFTAGKLSGRSALVAECGCPPPPPVLRAESTPAGDMTNPSTTSQASSAGIAANSAEGTAKPSPEETQPSHLTVETPFVFSANAQPAPARVQYSSLPNVFLPQEDVEPVVLPGKDASSSAEQAKPASSGSTADGNGKKDSQESKGFFGKFKGFFTKLFHL